MNNYKKAGIGSGGLKRVLKNVVDVGEEGAEGAAKSSIKALLKDLRKNIGDEAFKSMTRGEIVRYLKSPLKGLVRTLEASKYRNIIKFFAMSDDKTLKALIGNSSTAEMDKVIKKAILKSVEKGDRAAMESFIKDVGGGRKFITDMTKAKNVEAIELPVLKKFMTGGGPKRMVANIDNDLYSHFIKNPEVFKRLSAKSIGSKLRWGAGITALSLFVASNVYSVLISLWDYFAESTSNANTAISNVVLEMKDIITEGATTEAQDPELIREIRKQMMQLIAHNRALLSISATSKMRMAKSNDEVPGIASFYKNQIDNNLPKASAIVGDIELTFNNITGLMNEYNANWMESVTALGLGGSANRAKQVLVSIEKARNALSTYINDYGTIKSKLDEAANKTEPVTAGQRLMLVAQEIEKKTLDFEEPKDLYSTLAIKEVKEDKPNIVMEQVQKAVAPIVLAVVPRSIASSPTRFNTLFALFDAATVTCQAAIPQKLVQWFAGKGVPAAMNAIGKPAIGVASKAISSGAGSLAGAATAALTGLDVGHSLGKYLTSGDSLMDETSQLINYLEQSSSGAKDTEWGKLNRRMQTKLAGSAYIIEKGLNEVKSNTFSEKQLTESNVQTLINSINGMSKVSQGIVNILEVTNILKQEVTRDLYIKHGESVMGSAARGLDEAVNFVSTFGGLLGDRKVGENPTGFANIYNAMMDYVAEIEAMILKVQETLLPYKNNLEQFRGLLKEVQPLVADAAKEIEEGKA